LTVGKAAIVYINNYVNECGLMESPVHAWHLWLSKPGDQQKS